MNNQQLRDAYAKHGLIFRAIGGRSPKFTLFSYDYLPLCPKVTFFSRDRMQSVEENAQQFHADAKAAKQAAK